ncbi:MAG: UvrD-helicase domain-containing protein [Dehalococcoidia bacterium]|nr:UvrD-helicase domain-containing protein [Dehalococcoidia bacterium]
MTAGLNPAQKEAVETIEGPILILAGPGSGKTRVITQRIAYLIRECGVNPRHILAVTFTNKAAKEMAERLERLLGGSAAEMTMGTFHAICARILRQRGQEIGIDPQFVIYDDEDQLSLMKQAIKQVGLDPKQYQPRTFLSKVSTAKSQLLSPELYGAKADSYLEKMVFQCYQQYDLLLSQSKALDFDDLLFKTVQLFENKPETLARFQSRYHHVLVDEFQDTNITQYALTRQLAGKYKNICVVGDPDQSIYTWRQADIRNILKFEEDYPNAKVVKLEQNYRSTKNILEGAYKVIAKNVQRKQKDLWTENETGAPISLVDAYDEQDEAQFVVAEVERLVKENVLSLKDCVVLYRVNAQSRVLEEAFLRFGVPYRLIGGTRFYQRREVKDIIAYLRLANNPHDTVSLRRVINVPQRGIGQRTVEDLVNWADELGIPAYEALTRAAGDHAEGTFAGRSRKTLIDFHTVLKAMVDKAGALKASEMLDMVIERTGYEDYLLKDEEGEDRWENIRELSTVAHKFDYLDPPASLTTFLEEVALVSDIDNYDAKTDAVTLTTLHQAKGLEFGAVFIVGMEEKVFPHARAFPPSEPTEMEEERRLCYVGITRAKKLLYLVYANRRTFLGSTNNYLPSRFLADIPPALIKRRGTKMAPQVTWTAPGRAPVPAGTSASVKSTSSIKLDVGPGDRVRHEKFGEGVVVSTAPLSGDYQVTVAFREGGIKKLILSYARLEKIG